MSGRLYMLLLLAALLALLAGLAGLRGTVTARIMELEVELVELRAERDRLVESQVVTAAQLNEIARVLHALERDWRSDPR